MQHVHAFIRSFALIVLCLALAPASAQAQSAPCGFSLGFANLRAAMGSQAVGDCVENAWQDETGLTQQRTTVGLFVWRPSDNWTGFTDGYRTWIAVPNGVVVRPNYERFPWESDSGVMGTAVVAVPEVVIPPRPLVDVTFDWLSASVNGVSPHGHHAAFVKPGDEVTVRLNTVASHDAVFLVDIEIYDHQYGRDDERVKLWQTASEQHFIAGKTSPIEQRIAMPALPKGRYRVHLGVFTPDWHHMIAWNDYVGFLEVI